MVPGVETVAVNNAIDDEHPFLIGLVVFSWVWFGLLRVCFILLRIVLVFRVCGVWCVFFCGDAQNALVWFVVI